jgi:phi13 family phage major tail protein
MSKENKVKFNLKNVHYAKLNVDSEGVVTYEKPVAIPGGVELSLDAKGDTEEFYADGMVYYTSTANNGYEGDLEIALVPLSFETDILGNSLDDNKVSVENSNTESSEFALLFEFDGDIKSVRHVLYRCKATRPSVASKTNEDKKEVQTEKLSLKASPIVNGNVKTKTTAATPDEIYNKWYESVYIPVKTGVTSE